MRKNKKLKVVKRGKMWKIQNTITKHVYNTPYPTKKSAEIKRRIMQKWFRENKLQINQLT